ncbi:MAG: hypothetical protein QOF66_7013 [Mycobacterium sp.]|uniref:hypothetical protein n=1 Tax=Mycobacterium sp. TaxID=1785 RepID=UPI0028B3A18C|nr:hypothetical protein [Mycobacterium sp.]
MWLLTAIAIRDAVQALSIEVRAGLHTGECEVRGDDIGGIAVHIGALVSALAGPNDVLVSSTLRDLVIGSGLEFWAGCIARTGSADSCPSPPGYWFSTRRAAEIGDRDWHALLDAHDAVVRSQLARFRGREVSTSGVGPTCKDPL